MQAARARSVRKRWPALLGRWRAAPFILVILWAICAAADDGASTPIDSLSDISALQKIGLDLELWGWLYYGQAGQGDPRHTWGSQFQLDATETIAQRIAIAADPEFIDYDDDIRGDLAQLYVSGLLSEKCGTLLTVGKFDSPFGVEGREFWNRLTSTPSLLFRARPVNMRGIMLTEPLGNTNITLMPFAVTGFNDNPDIPGRPSYGLTTLYKPIDNLQLGLTNWIGPGLEPYEDYTTYAYYDYGRYYYDRVPEYLSGYASSAFELTDTGRGSDFASAGKGQLYFLDAQATWKPVPELTLAAEFLLVDSTVVSGDSEWSGALALANYDIDDQVRVFAQYSDLNDSGGNVTGDPGCRQEASAGIGFRVNQHLEFRTEYRHDFSQHLQGVDSVTFDFSFGY
jgi:hypothetical protein